MCVSSLPSRLSQFRIVLEIYSIEFSLFWEFHDIVRPLATPRETCFYVCKYLHWISVGTKIGTSIVFELENQKWRLNTRKDQVFTQMWVISEQKITKKFKLICGCQAITEKVQMQLWQNFAATKYILLQT